ncbi:type II toxin-antitoxin system HicA family toxin [Providencia huaxiensis]|uniref:type II toxin-antitoxin system HicA family toxin n=1 Tax=Providencia TaxID=586 RepID=UPI0019D0FEF7|nr:MULTISPECIES: type II toxin-antitoxin system HicA family toxin [Providencia]MBN6360457.1 type II toxin-antitoxin system HicA family toxin [Providencia huaxiensis]
MIKMRELDSKHRKTMVDILTIPPKSGLKWGDVTSLVEHSGGTIKNGSGSRRRFVLQSSLFLTHQPHPGNTLDKGAVNGLREWLENTIGVEYD